MVCIRCLILLQPARKWSRKLSVTKNAQSCTDTRFFQNHRQLLRRNCSPCTSPQKPGITNKMHNTIANHHLCSLSPQTRPSPLLYGSVIPEWSKLVQFVSYQTYHSLEILVILCLMLTRYRAQGFCWRTGHAPATRARASNLEPILEPIQKRRECFFCGIWHLCFVNNSWYLNNDIIIIIKIIAIIFLINCYID